MIHSYKIVQSAILSTIVFSAACTSPNHIGPYSPREREYTEGEYAVTKPEAEPAEGSIYSEAVAGYWEDTRARRTGDIVMIVIAENANAEGGASTDLSRNSSAKVGVSGMMGLMPAIAAAMPDLSPDELLAFMSSTQFNGEGQTSRQGKLNGNIAVRVKREMPNGDLYVEGTKIVMINNEEYHLYVSGTIRTADIEMNNSIDSNLIADAQVEFTGSGDVADQIERGWLHKILDSINPF